MRPVVKGFREPDVCADGWAVWYGPGGVDGDCATEAERVSDDEWRVTQYQHVGGYFDEYDENEPFLISSVVVTAHGPRVAARLGTDRMAEYGPDGMECFAASLPGGDWH